MPRESILYLLVLTVVCDVTVPSNAAIHVVLCPETRPEARKCFPSHLRILTVEIYRKNLIDRLIPYAESAGCPHVTPFDPSVSCWLRLRRSTMCGRYEQELPNGLHHEHGYC